MRIATAVLLVLPALAQDPEARLLRWMDRIAQQQLDARAAEIAKIRTPEQAEQRKQRVRAKILELLGGLPDYSGPLNPRVTGQLDKGAYIVEKVIFESLPRVYVTANLYRPKQSGRYPGVLLPLGHWEEGKPAVQRIAANLALKGFVVLVFDPLGQGERLQAYDRRLEASLAGGATDQHFMAGAQSLIAGESFARYRIWDAKRALDYLVSRPEVDSGRIGCTGCSGGGTLTTYISALDPRITAAAPACYMNSFRVLFSGPVGDSEQSLPNFLSSGLDQSDYVELFAPKPWLISSTLGDFFTPEGARQVYEEAKHWYRIYGSEEKIHWAVGHGGHGTPLEIREEIYAWFIRWLNGGKGDPREQEVSLVPDHDLFATKTGQVAEQDGSRDIWQVILEGFQKRKRQRPPEEMLAEIRRLVAPQKGAPEMRVLKESVEPDYIARTLAVEVDPGLELEWVLLAPRVAAGTKTGILVVESAPPPSPLAVRLARQGYTVLSLAPRGVPGPPDTRGYRLLGDWRANTRAWLIGQNLPALRARDILTGVEVLAIQPNVDGLTLRAIARGVPGVWLLMAAAIDTRLTRIWLDRTPHSLRAALDGPLHRNLHDAVIPGFALHWDLTDIHRVIRPRIVVWSDPADWMGHVARLTGPYRYRHFEQPDEAFVGELLR